MFGKRNAPPSIRSKSAPEPIAAPDEPAVAPAPPTNLPAEIGGRSGGGKAASPSGSISGGDDRYVDIKANVFNALVEAVDLTALGKLSSAQVREEITDIVGEIIAMQNQVLSAVEQQKLINDICNDVLGLGPLEPLLARDDIADIMVNGASQVYIETDGNMEHTDISFRDNAQLMNICRNCPGI